MFVCGMGDTSYTAFYQTVYELSRGRRFIPRLKAWAFSPEICNQGCLDELVIDDWLHIEQMDTRVWWMQIGDARIHVRVSVRGAPIVTIERGEYGPVNGETRLAPEEQ